MVLPGPGIVSPYKRPVPPELSDEFRPELKKRWHVVQWKSGAWTAFRSPLEARMAAEASGVRVLHRDDLP